MWGWIEREGLTITLRDYSVSQIWWCIVILPRSQDKMIVLASNSFEVKMSLCGDPESDVSSFLNCCVQHKRLARVNIKNATWLGAERAKVSPGISAHKVCANMPVSSFVSKWLDDGCQHCHAIKDERPEVMTFVNDGWVLGAARNSRSKQIRLTEKVW
jgi:hypothetical protein